MEPAFNPDVFPTPANNQTDFRKQYELQDDDTSVVVVFLLEPVKLAFQSEKQGKEVIEYREFIKIRVPGNDKSEVYTEVNEQHRRRFPGQYARFKAGMAVVDGTPLSALPGLMPEQIARFKTMHIPNLEALAQVSDVHGPNLGMGWRDLRKAAQEQLAKSGGVDAETRERMSGLEVTVAKQGEALAAATALIEQQREQLAKIKARKPRGRYRKRVKPEVQLDEPADDLSSGSSG